MLQRTANRDNLEEYCTGHYQLRIVLRQVKHLLSGHTSCGVVQYPKMPPTTYD